ncbi:MAG: hypothetical protein ACLPKT_08185 [Methylocella sp.]
MIPVEVTDFCGSGPLGQKVTSEVDLARVVPRRIPLRALIEIFRAGNPAL